jgi:hypothetical protein
LVEALCVFTILQNRQVHVQSFKERLCPSAARNKFGLLVWQKYVSFNIGIFPILIACGWKGLIIAQSVHRRFVWHALDNLSPSV